MAQVTRLCVAACAVALTVSSCANADDEPVHIAMTADTRGELFACQECGVERQLGGLARRAVLVNELRESHADLLLVDTGNALFGADTLPSEGKIMVSAYAAIGYDAVNLSYRDFRLGKEATARLVQTGHIPFVSANLIDEGTNEVLAEPFQVREIDGQKIAVIGVTQRPAGLAHLPHLKAQLAGIRIESPEAALDEWLPEARDQSDRVILLYYGSAAGMAPIRERFASELDLILVGGSRPEYLPADTVPSIVGTTERGQHLARIKLEGHGDKALAEVEQIAIDAELPQDADMEALLADLQPEPWPLFAPSSADPSATGGEISVEAAGDPVIGENLDVGMALDDAMAVLGMPESMHATGTGDDELRWMDYPAKGLSIGARPGGSVVEAIELGPDFDGRYPSGVQRGDHYAVLLEKYGMPAELTPDSARYPDRGLEFSLRDEKIVGMRMSLLPGEAATDETDDDTRPVGRAGTASNEAVRIETQRLSFHQELGGQQAPPGRTFALVETRWENIHPKQEVREGQDSLTTGVGSLGFGGQRKQEEEEYVEKDVPYRIERPVDHIFAVADGLAFRLHDLADEIPGGLTRKRPFVLEEFGQSREVSLVFLVPDASEHLALQLLDYAFGHASVPLAGDIELAKRRPKGLAGAEAERAELMLVSLDAYPDYAGDAAPNGWHYAVAGLAGKSLSVSGDVGNIIRLDPSEFLWASTKDGHIYYCESSSTAMDGALSFTPDIFEYQEAAFLVPSDVRAVDIGVRLEDEVVTLATTGGLQLPAPVASHADGDTLEILLFGARTEGDLQILDLGIRSLTQSSGIDIQAREQFILVANGEESHAQSDATYALAHRPPRPFTVPPGVFVRFELAYPTSASPDTLRYRGFAGETRIALQSTPSTTPSVSQSEIVLARGESLGMSLAESATGISINFLRPGSPAEAGGLMAGDVIVGVDHEPATTAEDLMALLAAVSKGQRARIVILVDREGSRHEFAVATRE